MQQVYHRQSKIKKFFVTYGFHVLFLLFLVNLVVSYVFHYYIVANGCMTMSQVQSDSRCLYIWGNQIYQQGDRANPHFGHPCGTNVTSIIPPSHTGNQAKYLLPNYIANLCPAVTSTPTLRPATPTPPPTVTPRLIATATSRPTNPPTARSIPVVTATPRPQATATPIPTQSSISNTTPTPTQVIITNNSLTAAPTIAATVTPTSPIILPSDTPIPTQVPNSYSAMVSVSLKLPGIGVNGNTTPLHTTRAVTMYIYNASDDVTNPSTKPAYTATDAVVYDGTNLFTSPNLVLGTIPTGQYQLVIKVPQYLQQRIVDPSTGATTFPLNPGQVIVLPQLNLVAGDINPYPDGDGIIDTSDYNIILSCYAATTQTTNCIDPKIADLNDDGVVDGTDYNIFLFNIRQYLLIRRPAISATPTLTLSPVYTPTVAISSPTILPTQTVTQQVVQPTTVITPTPPSLIASAATKVWITKILDFLGVLLLIGVILVGMLRSKLFKKTAVKVPAPAVQKPVPSAPVQPGPQSQMQSVPDEPYDKTVFVTVIAPDPVGGIRVQLTGDEGQIEGLYPGTAVPQGFQQVKGTKKTVNGKSYVQISEILPAE